MKGKIYTPVSLVKKTFKIGERSLSREEVIQRLLSLTNDHFDGFDAEKCIQAALDYPTTPFREGNSRAIIEYVQESQAFANHVYRFLNEACIPLTEEKILRKLRSLNLISWNFTFDRLGLNGDSRFSQLAMDERWVNSDWALVNDAVYNYLLEQGTTEISVRDVPFLIENRLGLPRIHCLFLPEVDDRFLFEGDMLYLKETSNVQGVPTEPSVRGPLNIQPTITHIQQSNVEVAAAMNNSLVDFNQETTNKSVVDGVVEDLMSALIKLEKRSSEMKEEVLQYFSSNNLDGISELIQEKDKNEMVLTKIKDIIDELS